MFSLWCVLACVLALLTGAAAGYGITRMILFRRQSFSKAQMLEDLAQARERASEIVEEARKEADHLRKEAELAAKDEVFQRRDAFAQESEQIRADLREQERRLENREDELSRKHSLLLRKERSLESNQRKLAERKDNLERRNQQLDRLIAEQTEQLHAIAGLSREQVEKRLLERVERDLTDAIARRLQIAEERLRQQAEQKAQAILAAAIHRYAAEHTADSTVSTVDIPSDEMKGRIIGREGRNIRTFEKLTGVDVIVDDTPGVVIVSAFDNIRREIARLALSKLIQDGRIHPSRIEEVVQETQVEMDQHILDVGQQAVLQADIGVVHDKLSQLLGRLKFRTSYSQNVLQHSLEVSHLCGMLADEIGLDGRLARRCALFHDIGKAADHEMEGGHPKIGAELARRYGETSSEVLHAIACHHDDVSLDHLYTVLVAAADAISASRPGARRETLEKYVKRLEQLEALACGFPGVEQVFAIQAGRELRIIAHAEKTSDNEAIKLCHDIARAIEQQLDYPGEIKVTVCRELRAVAVAR